MQANSTATHVEAAPLVSAERATGILGIRLSPRAAWTAGSIFVDASMLAVAVLAAELGSTAAGVTEAPIGWSVGFCILVAALFGSRGLYTWRSSLQVLETLRVVLSSTALAGMILLSLRVLATDDPSIAAQTMRLWAFAAVYLAAGRVALHWWQTHARRQGEALKPTLIVGAGRIGSLTAGRLLAHPELGLRPVGYLDKEPLQTDDGVPVLGASWDLERVVAEHDVQQVIVTFSTAPNEVLLGIIRRCEALGVEISFVPRLFEGIGGRLTVEHLGGLPLISARRADPKGWQFAIKHGLDRLVALIALALTLPVLGAGALAVWISMGRPIFFRQIRAGRDGRTFDMLKLRSMKPLAADDALLEADESERKTRVGELLRRTSIDELPQLINVLRGEMSLVGPRPERPELVRLFDEYIHRYDDRLRVKAGITGWSQVHGLGRGPERFAKGPLAERIEWDNYYIENWSLWLDFKITLMTLTAVFQSFRQGG